MGSPLGPILADIFIGHLEQKLRKEISNVNLYCRYVDDIFIISDTKEDGQILFDHLNSIHPNITLTQHCETDNCIAFLDVEISRRADGSIKRSVYRKNTWSGQYLHFTSFSPIGYKVGLVRTLFHRAREICSDDALDNEYDHLKKTLLSNGYPEEFIVRHSQPRSTREQVLSADKMKVILRLPFKGDDSSSLIAKRLKSVVKRTYYAAEPIIVFTTTRIPTSSVKEPLSFHAKSNCIYQFKCGCSAIYIGRTERQLRLRITEHVPVWLQKTMAGNYDSMTSPMTRRKLNSAITQHLFEAKHCVTLSDAFRILYTTTNTRILKYAEALAIRNYHPQLCKQREWLISLALPW